MEGETIGRAKETCTWLIKAINSLWQNCFSKDALKFLSFFFFLVLKTVSEPSLPDSWEQERHRKGFSPPNRFKITYRYRFTNLSTAQSCEQSTRQLEKIKGWMGLYEQQSSKKNYKNNNRPRVHLNGLSGWESGSFWACFERLGHFQVRFGSKTLWARCVPPCRVVPTSPSGAPLAPRALSPTPPGHQRRVSVKSSTCFVILWVGFYCVSTTAANNQIPRQVS